MDDVSRRNALKLAAAGMAVGFGLEASGAEDPKPAKDGVDGALEFIRKVATAEKLYFQMSRLKEDAKTDSSIGKVYAEVEKFHREVSKLPNHQAVEKFAESHGYKVTKKDLDAAMKKFLEAKMEEDGIPVWVRQRVKSDVHD